MLSQTIYVAAKLGVADLVCDGARPVDELAAATGVHARSLYRFLRALAAVAVFVEDDQGRFGLGPLGHHLRSDTPGSLRSYAIHANEESYRAWGEALYSVRTGQPAFDHVFGTGFYEYLKGHVEADEVWNRAMSETEWSFAVQMGMVAAYNWTDLQTVVDVGGSHGTLIAALLGTCAHLRAVVFDLPHVVEGARAELIKAGVVERCQLVGGDFFSEVPSGADAYILSRVLFNWDDDDATTILRNCRDAMRAGGRVLVMEPVIPPGNEADLAKLIDLNVFVICGGRTRNEAELAALFERAGLSLTQRIPTPSAWNIIEGRALRS